VKDTFAGRKIIIFFIYLWWSTKILPVISYASLYCNIHFLYELYFKKSFPNYIANKKAETHTFQLVGISFW